jgi:hypothetical protein
MITTLFAEDGSSTPSPVPSQDAPARPSSRFWPKWLMRFKELASRPGSSYSGGWIDLGLILAAGTLILLLHYQGWRNREMANVDMLPFFQGARDFLRTGRLLDRGDVSSYESFSPPGTFFLLIPGEILFRDGRLQDLIPNAILFLGTVVFAYLSAREIGGRRVGVAAACLVAVSRTGYQTVWPVGHPVIVVSMLFFLIRWVKNRSAPALAAALIIGAFGAYLDLGIAPFLVVVPIVWLVFRPPVGWRTVLGVTIVGLAIWFPYLRFEAGRDFVDLQSLIMRRPADQLGNADDRQPIYCYAALGGEPDMRDDTYLPYIGGAEIEARVIYPLAGWKNQAAYGICRILLNVDRNFDTNLFLLGSNRILNLVVWWIFMIGWSALSWVVFRVWRPVEKIVEWARRKPWILAGIAGGGAVLLFLGLNPDVLAFFSADKSLDRNTFLAAEQLRDFLPWVWSAVFLGLFVSLRAPDNKKENTLLLLAFSLPWLILVLLAEPGRPERFWFIWPLQITIVVVCLQWVSRRLPRAELAFSILALATGVALLPARLFADRAAAAWTQGYGGSDSDQWNVIAFLSRQAGVDADGTIKIEYWLPGSQIPGNAEYRVYRFEDWFTYLLESRTGVDVLDTGSLVDPTGGSWIVVDDRLEIPDALVGSKPAAVFGNYQIYRLP